MSKKRIFSGFEIFWHWAQTGLIFGLLLTGLELHGTYSLFGFNSAFSAHLVLALLLIALWVFAIFWHLTTGEWRQYLPSGAGVVSVAAYYLYGIFSGEPKPFKKTPAAKHNPLQRLAYFFFKAFIAPALWISGLLMLAYNAWKWTALGELLPLSGVAALHVVATFALMAFLVVHIYLAATTGTPWYAYLKSMVTGYHEQSPVSATRSAKSVQPE